MRPRAGQIEERAQPLSVEEGRRLHGSIPYGVESRNLGGFTEVIEPGALTSANVDDLVLTVEHAGVPLGRYPRTLDLEDRQDGLHWSVEPPRSRQDVIEAVERGDLRSASWRMVVGRDRWVGEVRHIESIKELRDVAIVATPAYRSAAVELRSQFHRESEDKEVQDEQTTVTEERPAEAAEATETAEEARSTEQVTEATEDRREAENRSQPSSNGGGRLRVEDRREEQAGETRVMEALDGELHSVSVGESRALTDSISIAPTVVGQVLFDRLRASAVVLQSGIRTIPIGAKAETWPTITGDVSPQTYAEGTAITPGDPTFGSITATPRKIAHLIQLDNEVVDDSSPAAVGVLTDHLLKVFALKLDQQLLEGSGTAPDIRGLKNVAGIQSSAAYANGGAITFDNLMAGLALLDAVSVPVERVAIVGHTRNKATLRGLRSTANGEYLWESALPAMGLQPSQLSFTPQLTTTETQGTSSLTNSVYLFDTQNVIYVRRTDPQIVLDRSRLFNSDQSELRATMRGDLIVPSPNAVVRLTGFTS